VKTLLIVYHTGGVKTAQMAQALERGALAALQEAQAEGEVRVVMKRCAEAGPEDVLAADAIALGTPENFGYMSGMMKDFLERVFYACEGKIEGRPWALFVAAGQDGSGAIASISDRCTGSVKSVSPWRAGRGRGDATVIRATPPSRASRDG